MCVYVLSINVALADSEIICSYTAIVVLLRKHKGLYSSKTNVNCYYTQEHIVVLGASKFQLVILVIIICDFMSAVAGVFLVSATS